MGSFDVQALTVYLDGDYVSGEDARISVFDHGLLYGDGVFEGMRVFDGGLFRPHEHLVRLERSARAVGLELPLTAAELLDVIGEVVRRSGLRDAHVRPILTRGFGTPGLDPRSCPRPTLVVTAYPFPPMLGTDPLRLVVGSVVRKAPRSVGAHVKSLNYLDAILAKQQAHAAGVDDAVMLDVLGAVAECTSTNLFLVVDGELATPTTRAALPGITRRTVLEVAREQGVPVSERDIWPMELYAADAIFLTGSGAGIVAVREVDGRAVATDSHPLYLQLRDGYRDRTRDERFLVRVADRGR